MMRAQAIAQAISLKRKDVQIVLVTNTAFCPPLRQRGYRCYRLPSDTPIVLDGKFSHERDRAINFADIKKIIDRERPELVLMDSELNCQVVDLCCERGIKVCFIFQNMILRKFLKLARYAQERKVDQIIVPYSQEELSSSYRDRLLFLPNVKVVGPVFRPAVLKRSPCAKVLRILIILSVEVDIPGERIFYRRITDFLRNLRERGGVVGEDKTEVLIITGPYFDERFCDLHGFKVRPLDHDLTRRIAMADLIIAPAAYNIVNEIKAIKTPAFLIPASRRGDDQRERAERLSQYGCAQVIDGDIWAELNVSGLRSKLSEMRTRFPELADGAGSAAEHILELLMAKPKVMILRSHWLPVSERFISDEVSALKRFAPVVACLIHNSSFEDSIEVLTWKGFECLWGPAYPVVASKNKAAYRTLLKYIEGECRSRGVALLHAEFLTDAIFFLPLRKRLNIPLVVSVRGADIYVKRDFAFRTIFVNGDLFLARSKKMARDLVKMGCPKHKVKVQHSGIKMPEYPAPKQYRHEIRLLMVGRLVEKKNTVFGIDIFDKICAQIDHVSLFIVGDGPLRARVLQRIRQSPYAARIKWCGAQRNQLVMQLMRQADILFQPSTVASNGDSEGIPGAVMEAMAMGVIVVASDHGSIREIVQHNMTGYIFKEADHEDAYAKLLNAMERIESSFAMKQFARQLVCSEFDIEREVARLEMYYDQLLKNGDGKRRQLKFSAGDLALMR